MMSSRNLRFAFFLAASAFFLLGPIQTQVLLGPSRSAKRPYLPVHWHMYHSVGVGFCQAKLYAQRDGARYDYPKADLVRIVGRGSARSRKRSERFQVGKKARESDVVLGGETELADVVIPLCEAEPDRGAADVRAEMRCSPPLPGGKWRMVEDGATNLCTRSKWTPSIPPPSSILPAVDPETGEPIDDPIGAQE